MCWRALSSEAAAEVTPRGIDGRSRHAGYGGISMRGWRRFLVATVGALSLVGAGGARGRLVDRVRFDDTGHRSGRCRGQRPPPQGGRLAVGHQFRQRRGQPPRPRLGRGDRIGARGGLEHWREPDWHVRGDRELPDPARHRQRQTASFPATVPGGDSTINTRVSLPHPCKKPEVFVGTVNATTGAFAWFAMSNADEEDDD